MNWIWRFIGVREINANDFCGFVFVYQGAENHWFRFKLFYKQCIYMQNGHYQPIH